MKHCVLQYDTTHQRLASIVADYERKIKAVGRAQRSSQETVAELIAKASESLPILEILLRCGRVGGVCGLQKYDIEALIQPASIFS